MNLDFEGLNLQVLLILDRLHLILEIKGLFVLLVLNFFNSNFQTLNLQVLLILDRLHLILEIKGLFVLLVLNFFNSNFQILNLQVLLIVHPLPIRCLLSSFPQPVRAFLHELNLSVLPPDL